MLCIVIYVEISLCGVDWAWDPDQHRIVIMLNWANMCLHLKKTTTK